MRQTLHRRDFLQAGSAAALVGLSANVFGQQQTSNQDDPFDSAYQNGEYKQPDLPYEYDALEPLYSEQQLKIHYQKHHSSYVSGLNSTLEQLQQARQQNDWEQIKALSRDLAFNGSGHVLHIMFWSSMTPGGSEMPDSLGQLMNQSFGSVQAGKTQFAEAAKAVEASGWAVLAYEPIAEKLLILQSEKHQNLTFWGVLPLLVCDVWEHAYYLQYANERAKWVGNFMSLANWQYADNLLSRARKLNA